MLWTIFKIKLWKNEKKKKKVINLLNIIFNFL